MLHDDILEYVNRNQLDVVRKAVAAENWDKINSAPETTGVNIKGLIDIAIPAFDAKPVPIYFEHLIDAEDLDKPAFTQPLVDTARDFYKEGILNLPYPSVLLIITIANSKKAVYLVLHELENKSIGMILMQSSKGREREPVITNCATMDRNLIMDFVPILLKKDFLEPETVTQENYDDMIEMMQLVFKLSITCLLMFGMPHYVRQKFDVPEKVNLNRIKNGKEPYAACTKVYLRKDIQRDLNKGHEPGYSVRPHWRRGHIRRLSSGACVPVRACMINWEGEKDIEKNTYIADAGNS